MFYILSHASAATRLGRDLQLHPEIARPNSCPRWQADSSDGAQINSSRGLLRRGPYSTGVTSLVESRGVSRDGLYDLPDSAPWPSALAGKKASTSASSLVRWIIQICARHLQEGSTDAALRGGQRWRSRPYGVVEGREAERTVRASYEKKGLWHGRQVGL